jgi:hypothetical protein
LLFGALAIVLRWCKVSVIVTHRKLLDLEEKALICGGGFKRIWLTLVSECSTALRQKSALHLLLTKTLDCVSLYLTGECGTRFRQYFWPEYHEHGEGSWVPIGRWVRRAVGEFPVHRLLLMCCWSGIPGSQSYLSRLVFIHGSLNSFGETKKNSGCVITFWTSRLFELCT